MDRLKEIIIYSLVEVIGYIIFILLGIIIRSRGMYYIFANLVAYGCEVIIKYLMCKSFVFYRVNIKEYNSFIVFMGIELIGIAICNIKRLIYVQSWILIVSSKLIKYILNYYNFKLNK